MRRKVKALDEIWAVLEKNMLICATGFITYKITKLTCFRHMGYREKKCYRITYQWVKNKQQNIRTSDWFLRNGYQSIAIYGMGELGQLLYEDIKDSEIEIKYVIDKNSVTIGERDLVQVTVADVPYMDSVDVIVITAPHIYDEMVKNLSSAGARDKTISIENVICGYGMGA